MPPRDIPTLQDGNHRRINYLRLSITDRCDLRCRYCMSAEGEEFLPVEGRLSVEEMQMLARCAVGLGIRKIRITGGEPLVHPQVIELLREIRALPGLERLVLTTNGQRLAERAAELTDLGLDGVNISLDSLRPGRYAEITRGGRLERCLAGIDAALEAGLHTKLNVVVLRGENDDEVMDFVELARTRPLTVRFIEHMPTQGGGASRGVPADELLARIAAELELIEQPRGSEGLLAGPARVFRIAGWAGSVGVIAPVSHAFCADCNRIRVGADGLARGCLFLDDPVDLKPMLRAGDEAALTAALVELVARKPARHGLADGDGGEDFPRMSRMGG